MLFAELGADGKLPTPTKLHHIVEDFLTHWLVSLRINFKL